MPLPLLILTALFAPDSCRAAQAPQTDALTIEIHRLGPTVAPTEIAPPADPGGADPVLVLDAIVNIGQRLWAIVEKNKPVVDVRTQYAVAVPSGTANWGQLEGWKPPRGQVYGFLAKNGFGATVIEVRYQVLRTYGGSFKGKGRYLTAVAIEPLLVEVAWGYKFSISVEVPDSGIVNAGTTEDPVAGMLAVLKWRIETPLKDSQGQAVYYMQGDGLYREVGGPFRRDFDEKVAKSLREAVRFPE